MFSKKQWIVIVLVVGIFVFNLYTTSCALGIPFDFEHIFELIYWSAHKTIVMR